MIDRFPCLPDDRVNISHDMMHAGFLEREEMSFASTDSRRREVKTCFVLEEPK